MPLDYHVGATGRAPRRSCQPLSGACSRRIARPNQAIRPPCVWRSDVMGAPVDLRRSAPRSRKPAAGSASRTPSERLNGDTADLFALQDEITSRIAVALGAELIGGSRPTDRSSRRAGLHYAGTRCGVEAPVARHLCRAD